MKKYGNKIKYICDTCHRSANFYKEPTVRKCRRPGCTGTLFVAR